MALYSLMCGGELDVSWHLEMSTRQAVLHGEIDPHKDLCVIMESFADNPFMQSKCTSLGEDVIERNLKTSVASFESKY